MSKHQTSRQSYYSWFVMLQHGMDMLEHVGNAAKGKADDPQRAKIQGVSIS